MNIFHAIHNPPAQEKLLAPVTNAAIINSSNSITITCSDPNTEETSMRFEIADDVNFTIGVRAATLLPNSTLYQWTGLLPATTYYFRVIAEGDGLNFQDSDPSNVVPGTTSLPPGDTNPPTVPTGLSLSIVEPGPTFNADWDNSTDAEGTVIGYNCYVNDVKDNPSLIPEQPSFTVYTVSGLIAGNKYKCEVSAVDNAQNESAKSSPVYGIIAPGMTTAIGSNQVVATYALNVNYNGSSFGFLVEVDSGFGFQVRSSGSISGSGTNQLTFNFGGAAIGAGDQVRLSINNGTAQIVEVGGDSAPQLSFNQVDVTVV